MHYQLIYVCMPKKDQSMQRSSKYLNIIHPRRDFLELSKLRIEVELQHELEMMYGRRLSWYAICLASEKWGRTFSLRSFFFFLFDSFLGKDFDDEFWEIVMSRPWILAHNFESILVIDITIILTILSILVIHLQTDSMQRLESW